MFFYIATTECKKSGFSTQQESYLGRENISFRDISRNRAEHVARSEGSLPEDVGTHLYERTVLNLRKQYYAMIQLKKTLLF